MKYRCGIRALWLAAAWVAGWMGNPAMAQSVAPAGPDPREIPIPRIQGPLGNLPGVDRLSFTRFPTRKELDDAAAAAGAGRGNPR
jgi:hypothetical protein